MKYLTVTVRGLPAGTTKRQVEDHFNSSIHPESPCIAAPVIEELQGGTCSTTVTLRKESKGNKRDCVKLRDFFNRSTFGGRQSTISVSDTFRGLIPLAGSADAPCHIYFVHGLGGHAFKTWSSDVQDDDISTLKAWPRDFLPRRLLRENINARVYSLGYNANVLRKAAPNASIISAAEDLLSALRSDRTNDAPREIYFVCHSLGGIIVAQAINMALFQDEGCPNKDAYRNLFIRQRRCLLKGVLLMGTPLRGSGQANMMVPLVRLIKGLDILHARNDNFLRALKENTDSLEIPNIVQRFKSVIRSNDVALLIACEEEPYIGPSLTSSYESSVSIFGDIVTPFRILESDHVSMVKFGDENEIQYHTLENLLIKMIQEGLSQRGEVPVQRPQQRSSDVPQRAANENATSNHEFDRRPSPLTAQSSSGVNVYISLSDHQNFPPRDPSPRLADSMPNRPRSSPQSNNYASPPPNQQQTFRRAWSTDAQSGRQDGGTFSRLGRFDTAFIIDDTGSMGLEARTNDPPERTRWAVTKEALEHLANIAVQYDSDGIDIRFLMSNHLRGDNIKSAEEVREKMDQIDIHDETHGGGTYFTERLRELIDDRILYYQFYKEDMDDYIRRLRSGQANHWSTTSAQAPTAPKPFNLIVITDGAANDQLEVEEYLLSVARRLDAMQAPDRQIGIQFIQVGQDPGVKSWLDRLDNDICNRQPPVRDIIDTTPWDSHLIQCNDTFTGALTSVIFENVLRKSLLGGVTSDEDRIDNRQFMSAELGS